MVYLMYSILVQSTFEGNNIWLPRLKDKDDTCDPVLIIPLAFKRYLSSDSRRSNEEI